jgi:hypothetical protein
MLRRSSVLLLLPLAMLGMLACRASSLDADTSAEPEPELEPSKVEVEQPEPEPSPDDASTKGEIGEVGIGTVSGSGQGRDYGDVPAKNVTGKATVTGSMDADIGRRIIHAHAKEVRKCWDQAAPGEVALELDVDAKGKVTANEASAPTEVIQRCVEKAAATWTFPEGLAGSIALTMTVDASAP